MRLNLLLASVAAVAMAAPLTTAAQTPQQNQPVEVEIDQGVLRPLQIAVVPFAGTHGSDISNVVSANLKRSGFFEPLNPSSFIETGLTLANAPNFPQWTQIGAQAVLYGGVTTRGDGRLDVGFRLYDPYRQCQLVSYQFTATQEQWRRIAHKISDVIYQRMTGEAGFFDSRVIFVSEEGTQLNRINRLTIADQDGFNPTYLTQGDEVIMSPRFSLSQPDEITYVALGKDYSRIYLYNLTTGRRESLGEFDGQVLAPRFSNDGNKIAFSIIRGGNTDVYVMDLRSRQITRLTSDPGIDTSPSFSPDGSQIVFTSDRSGSARLYVMRSDGSGQRPISRGGGIYTAPSWSPTGNLIAFTKQGGGRFSTGVMNADGSGERILSSSYFEEGPNWAPNGRYVMFARQTPGGDTRLWTVDLSGRVVSQAGYNGRGTDPAWSPLLDRGPSNLGVNQGADSCPA
ncbi:MULTISPECIES: Tol-Pal system beta propeller repeat protein TolB [Brevundimonas]|jgi:TolB protein|uniref:Tol-Pal system protein TolB n=2 Tax=Brevundimonas TaxID=41275 RepID=A0A2X1BLQ9_BREVE|nr:MULTISPECIES: Tol-Pal system beta propeller repeat protein TolB [Brevundimonas]MRL68353.1 Tol-Pal system protein TolB [Brevundimonas sp. SPF441]NSX34516.1 Tol-Pal system protein TolB [Brevundimonas vesicularis]QIF82834.1 Tol-Pal system protein TolB [Brevundimonas sp. 'scallop']QSF54171.1 Tol-Pal system protein TolB [Brevundimonas fontaquae]WBT05998.1 Tol-Pal system beta propeller repeat protein TolB [Brevundimonas vesicularis]